jgi:ABC-type branched-subunit amino acid transport system substrate-binding protein/serine/threonine protein kinase
MEICCTRIGCAQPVNDFPELDDTTLLKTVPQCHCQECGMPLILDSRYLPIQQLRKGGFGNVYLAYDRRTPTLKRCIIKQLQFNPRFNSDQIATATTLFHREAEVLETLGEHPRIPRFYAFLEMESPANGDKEQYDAQKFCYLVQEYIEGQDLQLELHQKERLSLPEMTEVLQQILEILEFIHSKGVIHRDIKPSNIVRDRQGQLHLIDFGAVKQIISTATQLPAPATHTGICTPEYAPMEQRQCSAIYPSSDLYALGVTCLHLVTGEHPPNLFDYHSHAWNWSEIPIPEQTVVRSTLERMLQEAPLYRFTSATAALSALSRAHQSRVETMPPLPTQLAVDTVPQRFVPKLPGWKWAGGGVATVVASGLIAVNFWRPPIASSNGQQVLITAHGSKEFQRFNQAGVAAMAQRKYAEAAQQFQQALKQAPNSPETRIYLNNAQVANQASYTVAVSVPITEDSNYRTLEMLRGFAQAQEQANREHSIKIKLEIFNDEDKPEKAEGIAKMLAARSDVLAVVGHNSSAVSMAAAKIYNSQQLVFVAPISTTSNLTGADRPYIFRTTVRSDFVSQKLAKYMLDRAKRKKAAIFYVPEVRYSEELKAQFSNQISNRGGEVVGNFDLTSNTSSSSLLQQAIAKGADSIVLFPTRKYRDKAFGLLRYKHRNHRHLQVFGDIATLYHFDTLENVGEASQGMILGVSGRASTGNTGFNQLSQSIWQARTNWATATSYDAVKAIGDAIAATERPTRETVKDRLSSSEFQGAAGPFRFFGGESESQDTVTMMRVQKTPVDHPYGSRTGQDFIEIPASAQ